MKAKAGWPEHKVLYLYDMNQQDEQPQNDPDNYQWGFFYVNPRDERILVPKRLHGLGWTINFGNPRTGPYLLLVMVVSLGLIFLVSKI